MEMVMDLTRMKSGEKGKVIEIQSGWGLMRRLETLGIRPGVEVEKVSAQLVGGPITIQVGNTQASLGFGMAMKVIVELIPPEKKEEAQ